ncbi:MAG: bifunctional glutamate N-acetyltransferase/amino-acid acetyltransferase ArgJ [Eubacteriaceae bacterium]|nr:bifunctional glutamate N-acetyltransferase/amino-acid acetyltransferase ArgJ [Eubacteriaceae bacterium]
MEKIKGGITAASGFKAGGISAGLKKESMLDLALIQSDVPATAAIVTTTNAVKAAPVTWDTNIVKKNHTLRAIIANSGNANACTGEQGLKNVEQEARSVAMELDCKIEEVAVASTGVIGVDLPINKITTVIPFLAQSISSDSKGSDCASRAILTTDLVPKVFSVSTTINGKKIHIGGIAKGSGMICPNMATMLSFITTDASISYDCLQTILTNTVQNTYNMMSVDGDMSTNDTVLVLANGVAGNSEIISPSSQEYQIFEEAFYHVNEVLAKSIVKDGEGATKFIQVSVYEADSEKNAKTLAKSVVKSNLVKTAFFGEDANWGRVLSSIGASGVPFKPENVSLSFKNNAGNVSLLKKGRPVKFEEEDANAILKEKNIEIEIFMGMGHAKAKSWGCDLSYEYVKINGEYRT